MEADNAVKSFIAMRWSEYVAHCERIGLSKSRAQHLYETISTCAAWEVKGPGAYPSWELNGQNEAEMTERGMLLRDWFAGQTLGSLVLAGINYPDQVAWQAYNIADAMLRERKKQG